ncbi:MAG: hypothetical protein IJU84_09565 [Clostridia bacterium]|nr:hypothetical protein [Clostridia bacterium]
MIKKMICFITGICLGVSVTACSGTGEKKTSSTVSSASSGTAEEKTEQTYIVKTTEEIASFFVMPGPTGVKMILPDQNALLVKEGSGYVFRLETADGKLLAVSIAPVCVTLVTSDGVTFEETVKQIPYERLGGDKEGNLTAEAIVEDSDGTALLVSDRYMRAGGGIRVKRTVRILKKGSRNKGYNSRIALQTTDQSSVTGNYEDCEYFIPSVLYKDNKNMATGSIGSSFRVKSIQVKETRTGLPMTMVRNKATGATVSISHYRPEIYSPDERNYQATTVSDEFGCGSVGILRDPAPQACFTYPNYETQGYVVNKSATKRFADLSGKGLEFEIGIFAGVTADYASASVLCYEEHFSQQKIALTEVDLNRLYDTSVADLKKLFSSHASGACGVPFATFVDNGENFNVSYEIGFIGMQTSLAHQMIRYGLKHTDPVSYNNGIAIIDYWTENAAMDSGVFKIWSFANGGFTSSPCYLRSMTDGAEGIFDAYRLILQEGRSDIDTTLWAEAITGYANFLVEKQNADGSWYRAYDYGGNMFTDENGYGQVSDSTTMADSKLNTPVPIRFLVRMYEWTGQEKYLNCAIKAGNYVIENISSGGKYVGGTPDNANTCDREAGIFAIYAFNALYSATKNEKYLTYAEQAAIFTVSWTYTYKFSVANPDGLIAGKAFEKGMNDGLSVIATGHSSIDTFMAYIYYELFKLYVWTENPFFYDYALFIQNNTKQTVSMVSDLQYAYNSFAIEATDISNFYFVTAERRGVWLPWITNANIEPIANMMQTFGEADVRQLQTYSIDELKGMLTAYGAGGHTYGYVK